VLLTARLPPTLIVFVAAVPLVNVPPDRVKSPLVVIVVDAPLTATVPPEMVMLVTLTLASTVTVPLPIVTVSANPGTPEGLQFVPTLQFPTVFVTHALASA